MGRIDNSVSLDKSSLVMLYSLQMLVKRARLSEDLMLDDGFGCGSFLNMVDEEES